MRVAGLIDGDLNDDNDVKYRNNKARAQVTDPLPRSPCTLARETHSMSQPDVPMGKDISNDEYKKSAQSETLAPLGSTAACAETRGLVAMHPSFSQMMTLE